MPGIRPEHRRRRAVALAVALAIGAAVVFAVTSSTSQRQPLYHPSLAPQTLTPDTPAARTTKPACRAASSAARAPRPAASELARIDAMTLAQRVAGLFVVELPDTAGASYAQLGAIPWAGAILTRPAQGDHLQGERFAAQARALLEAAGDRAPLIGAQQIGGIHSVITDEPPVAASRLTTPAAARAAAATSASALRRLGFNLVLLPLADVDVPQGPLTGQLFSSDPQLVARLAPAAIAGYTAGGVIAVAGHFPGEGAASADPDQFTATVGGSLASLQTHDLIPFAAIAPVAPAIQTSNAAYAAFDGVTPASLQPAVVALLRERCGFTGAIVSGDIDATLSAAGSGGAGGVASGAGTAALAALNAGDDLLSISGTAAERASAYRAVLAAAERDPAVAARVRAALIRVLVLKRALNPAAA